MSHIQNHIWTGLNPREVFLFLRVTYAYHTSDRLIILSFLTNITITSESYVTFYKIPRNKSVRRLVLILLFIECISKKLLFFIHIWNSNFYLIWVTVGYCYFSVIVMYQSLFLSIFVLWHYNNYWKTVGKEVKHYNITMDICVCVLIGHILFVAGCLVPFEIKVISGTLRKVDVMDSMATLQ